MSRKSLTHNEFLEKFYEKNLNAENIEILSEYKNARTKIKCKCKIDGYEWEATPNNLLNGTGCKICCDNKKKLTHEEFINRMKEVNNDIEILGEYINNATKIKCRCKIDNYIFETRPQDLLNGIGCPKCSNKIKNKTTGYFINELKEINDNIEVLGEYKGSKVKIKCRCKKDGYEWEAIPQNLLKGSSCPKCAGKYKTTEDFKQELEKINNNIEVLGEYINATTKIKVRCKKDGNIWNAKPNDLLSGYGCPQCNESKGEKRIRKYLDNKNINYEKQYRFNDCKNKKTLPFDFYISSLNIAIEYDGEQHYKIIKHFGGLDNLIITVIRDTIKTKYCEENNIKLIRIPYWDFDKIEEILEKELIED